MSTRGNHSWMRRLWVWGLLATGLGYGGWSWWQHHPTAAPNYQTTHVSRGEITKAITASGQLNPLVQVQVGSQISGNIKKLLVDFNSTVTEGQVVAELDPATYEANYLQAQGNLANARAYLEFAELQEKRTRELQANKLNPVAEYEKAQADLHSAQANVTIHEGALKKAAVDLARCTIYSPISGIVLSRNVDVGQTVAASLSAPTLFLIANDLTRMQIDANLAEADIGQVEAGMEAEFTVDAYPGQTFRGTVTQIRNVPRTDQNVVTYATMIDVANPNLKLKPGMTANVSIIVARRPNALRVLNSALRFRPPKNFKLLKTPGSAAGILNRQPEKSKSDKTSGQRTVYRLRENSLEPVKVQLGLSDGKYTELIDGLSEGEELVVDMAERSAEPAALSRLISRITKRS